MTVETPATLLLDTDTLSAVMRGNRVAESKARDYLVARGRFCFSIITRYEILRGLKAKQAARQIAFFERLCARSDVLTLTDASIVRAAELYAELRARGALIGDADILIAATALVRGAGVVTNNQGHFNRIDGLYVENWLR
ncbi:MAG TPA: type II toxin-antitoxin system VapC family toxin [Candidatus Hydrogenedentes bacterium]|nr:type II toxin-antitoxin system VapC family toxin [Candidatus Hydrogenedentota bacterium]